MDVISAAHKTVHNPAHGGSPALAARLGISSPNVLNSKVNPKCDTHHLRLDEALAIMEFTDDHTIIQAMAQRLGGVFTVIDSESTEKALVVQVLHIGGQGGCLLTAFENAIEDGTIDSTEHDAMTTIIQQQKKALQALEQALDSHCERAGKRG